MAAYAAEAEIAAFNQDIVFISALALLQIGRHPQVFGSRPLPLHWPTGLQFADKLCALWSVSNRGDHRAKALGLGEHWGIGGSGGFTIRGGTAGETGIAQPQRLSRHGRPVERKGCNEFSQFARLLSETAGGSGCFFHHCRVLLGQAANIRLAPQAAHRQLCAAKANLPDRAFVIARLTHTITVQT